MAHAAAAGAGVTVQQALDEVVPQSTAIGAGRLTGQDSGADRTSQ